VKFTWIRACVKSSLLNDHVYPDQLKARMEIVCWMHFQSWKVACQCLLVAIAYCSFSACTSSSWLVKLDRPMIKSPGLVMLDHSLCAYCKTTCYVATNWGKVRGGIFRTWPQLSLLFSSSSLLTAIQNGEFWFM